MQLLQAIVNGTNGVFHQNFGHQDITGTTQSISSPLPHDMEFTTKAAHILGWSIDLIDIALIDWLLRDLKIKGWISSDSMTEGSCAS